MKRICASLVGAIVAVCAMAQTPTSQDIVDIGIDPVFLGSAQPRFCMPVRITIENNGKDARGVVEVKLEGFKMRYPIDSPNLSKKSFTSYVTVPGSSYGGSLEVTYRTNVGTFLAKLPLSLASNEDIVAAAIHDRDGAINFTSVRQESNQSRSENFPFVPLGVTPDHAPDRAVGYLGVNSLILSEGSERLSDPQVEAIKEWVAGGGSLFFMGGSGSPVNRDPRWTGLLPVRTMGSPINTTVPKFGAAIPFQPVGLVPGAIVLEKMGDGAVLSAVKPYGAGSIRWSGVDPVDSPLRERPATVPIVRNWLRQGSPSFRSVLALSSIHEDPYSGMMPGMARIPGMPSGRDDPFDAKLPSALTLFSILAGYAAIVVLANLLILRALKKGELAWITTPIISLVFAFVIFRFAGNLYSASLSRSTQGLIFIAKDSESAFFLGRVQMFFPQGGSYKMPMEGLQGISAFQQSTWDPNSGNVFDALQPIDIGQVVVPAATVGNLNFQEFYAYQSIPWQGKVTGKVLTANANSAKVEILNGNSLQLSDSWVYHNGATYHVGPLKPGEVAVRGSAFSTANTEIANLVSMRLPKQGTFFFARVVDAPVGPQIGTTVTQRDDVILVTNL